MATYRLQVQFGADSPDLRDRIVITPHFSIPTVPGDWDALALEACTKIKAWLTTPNREIRCTWYGIGAPPNPPLGQAVTDAGIYPATGAPREVALCLSYYSGFNMPGRRGRLYLPVGLWSGLSTNRPTSTQMDKVKALGPVLADIGGTAVGWVVYSRRDAAAFAVTDYYCDDEWDVQRSRGLRPTSRVVGTTEG